MLHGLTADLERALKDKERYRKRLKDVQDTIPAVPRTPAVAAEIRDAQHGHAAVASIDSTSSTAPPLSPRSPRGIPHQVAPSQDSQISSALDESDRSGLGKSIDTIRAERPMFNSMHPVSPRKQPVQNDTPSSPDATTPKAVSSPGEKARKAAPAPLDLSQSSPSLDHHPNNAQLSASDYGEDGEEGGAPLKVPEFERGRRRTREEDDHEREMIAFAEEQRSKSERSSKKDKSKQKSPQEGQGELETFLTSPTAASAVEAKAPPASFGAGLPSSPKASLPVNFPAATATAQQPAESIASVLAPPETTRTVVQAPQTATLPAKSPGLPMSPKPSDRPPNAPAPRPPVNGIGSPGPASPRQGLPLSPRAPKYPIPMPNTAPISTFAASMRKDGEVSEQSSMAERIHHPSVSSSNTTDSSSITKQDSPDHGIYRGFASDQYPGLILTPNALPLVNAKVWSSRLRPATQSRAGKAADEDGVFTLSVHLRSSGRQLWRTEKKPTSLAPMDHALRQYVKIGAPLPDRSIFSGHAPAKVDTRRAALNRYFEALLDTPMDDKTALIVCDYFSRDAIEPQDHGDGPGNDEPTSPVSPKFKLRKEGYLAKKGKQFGGWKSRYFILESAQLKHFESPQGGPLGIIKLQNAQIARPNAKDLEEDAEFRHAFTILEPKRKDSSSFVRHVLCAESDQERDGWVEALLAHVTGPQPIMQSPPTSPKLGRSGSNSKQFAPPDLSKRNQRTQGSLDSQAARELQAVNYDSTIALDAPHLGTPAANAFPAPSPLVEDYSSSIANAPNLHPNISGPVAGGPIQNASIWGNKSLSPTRGVKDKEAKKRSVFGFMSRSGDEQHGSHGMKRGLSPRPPTNERRHPARAIFGIPLADAAEYSQPTCINICLPSPVYRCIEYLEDKDAASEEGIFRLSGSNTMIKSLKERFDNERDVNLLEGDYVDVHAVASLLKLYLRELPDTVLTRDKFIDFQKVLGKIWFSSAFVLFANLKQRLKSAPKDWLQSIFLFTSFLRPTVRYLLHCQDTSSRW